MTQHYRHHRVVSREKQAEPQSYCDMLYKTASKEPFLALGVFLLFFILFIKCLCCHK